MELRVHKIVQTASGGSHVTIYEAEVELVPGEVRVEMTGIDPTEAHPNDIAAAQIAIQRGAEKVLQPIGSGALIQVRRIVIHPIDFKPRQFERQTEEELRRQLSEAARSV